MQRIFWLSLVLLLLYELASVYFIMPMPGSQKANTLQLAYFLYSYRWWFRIALGVLLLTGLLRGSFKRNWVPFLGLVPVAFVVYVLNFKMSADHMFRQVKTLAFNTVANNRVDSNRLVIGLSIGDEAKAYPIRFLGYHHFVADSVGGQPVLVTYCTVCRTGRVYDSRINGEVQNFRLVGMDHFNAMIEDKKTKSWWQQATGEAVAGPMKGHRLHEILSTQTTLAEWIKKHPQGMVMQPDPNFENKYDTTLKFEDGTSRKALTGSDSLSWQNKSWVVGIERMGHARAYDWNQLKASRIIKDTLAGESVLIVLASDGKSFYAFAGSSCSDQFRLSVDTLIGDQGKFFINGRALSGQADLKPVNAYQEFWHSWRTFRPHSGRYPNP